LGDAQLEVTMYAYLGRQAGLDLAEADRLLGQVGLGPGDEQETAEHEGHGDHQTRTHGP